METAPSGAIRSVVYPNGPSGHPIRLDLLLTNDEALRRLAETFGEGNEKYGPDNWKKGFKESVFIGHCIEHLLQHMNGDTSEDHLAHAAWNLCALMWVQKHHPELIDISTLPAKLAMLQTAVNDDKMERQRVVSAEQAQEAYRMAGLINSHPKFDMRTLTENACINDALLRPTTLRWEQYNFLVNLSRALDK